MGLIFIALRDASFGFYVILGLILQPRECFRHMLSFGTSTYQFPHLEPPRIGRLT